MPSSGQKEVPPSINPPNTNFSSVNNHINIPKNMKWKIKWKHVGEENIFFYS